MSSGVPRIGLIGTGWWATEHHLPSLAGFEGARLTAVADADIDRARAAATRFDIGHAFDDAEDLYASGTVDGVIIATTHATHHRLARAALDHGLHVFVEKPLALTARDAWDLVARSDDQGVHLMVGYTHLFTSTAQELRSVVASGWLGELIAVAAIFTSSVEQFYRGEGVAGETSGPQPDTYADPKAGGGQGHTQVTHALGMLLTVTAELPIEAHAYMTNGRVAVDLADAISFRFEGGAVGSVASSGSIRGEQPDAQVIHYLGSDGAAIQDLGSATVTLANGDGPRRVLSPAPDEGSYPADVPARRFAEVISGRSSNPAPAGPAARATALLESAYLSAATGKPVAVWSPDTKGISRSR